MVFNSYSFIFIFLPVFLLGVRLISETGRSTLMKMWLIVMSVIFFVCFGAFSSGVFLASIVWNAAFSYAVMKALGISKRSGEALNDAADKASPKADITVSIIKAIAILGNVVLLAFFKYFSPAGMPVAISFYTFGQIAFIAELGREAATSFNLLDYLCYILFFPKVMQGPIAEYSGISSSIAKLCDRGEQSVTSAGIMQGISLFSIGLIKKVVFAEVLGGAVNFAYQGLSGLTALDAVIVAVSYSFQLYFDFSGYCDMAEGICRMMGMELCRNFDAPYKARNIAQFWDRWHISLTKFFTRYIYIPLGGSRKGAVRTYINILVVFAVSGLWHGTGWNFLIWGMMHGVMMVAYRLYRVIRGVNVKNSSLTDTKHDRGAVSVFCTALNFIYVTIAWVFFRAATAKDAVTLISKLISPDAWRGFHISVKLAECFRLDELWYILKVTPIAKMSIGSHICMWMVLCICAYMVFFGKTARTLAAGLAGSDMPRKKTVLLAVFYGFLFSWGVLSLGGVSTFLYVNF